MSLSDRHVVGERVYERE